MELEQLQARLARVETTNRWLLRGGLAALFVVGLFSALGWRGKAFEAESYVLRDREGRQRAVLTTRSDGGGYLSFFDRFRVERLAVGVDPDRTPVVCLFDDEHLPRAVIRLDEANLPVVALLGEDANNLAILRVTDAGSAGLALFDEQNRIRARLDLDDQGAPHLRYFNEQGSPQEQPSPTP